MYILNTYLKTAETKLGRCKLTTKKENKKPPTHILIIRNIIIIVFFVNQHIPSLIKNTQISHLSKNKNFLFSKVLFHLMTEIVSEKF